MNSYYNQVNLDPHLKQSITSDEIAAMLYSANL